MGLRLWWRSLRLSLLLGWRRLLGLGLRLLLLLLLVLRRWRDILPTSVHRRRVRIQWRPTRIGPIVPLKVLLELMRRRVLLVCTRRMHGWTLRISWGLHAVRHLLVRLWVPIHLRVSLWRIARHMGRALLAVGWWGALVAVAAVSLMHGWTLWRARHVTIWYMSIVWCRRTSVIHVIVWGRCVLPIVERGTVAIHLRWRNWRGSGFPRRHIPHKELLLDGLWCGFGQATSDQLRGETAWRRRLLLRIFVWWRGRRLLKASMADVVRRKVWLGLLWFWRRRGGRILILRKGVFVVSIINRLCVTVRSARTGAGGREGLR